MNRIGKKEGEGRWYYRCYRPWAGIGVAAMAVGSQRDELPSERLSAWLSDRLPQQQRKENEGVPGVERRSCYVRHETSSIDAIQ